MAKAEEKPATLVGRTMLWKPPIQAETNIRVRVFVVDLDKRFGKWKFLVRPEAGMGETWVERQSLVDVEVTQ